MSEAVRKRPFGIRQLYQQKCHCCGGPARFQWNACADGNVWRALCSLCDVKINIAVMKVLDPANWRERILKYCEEINFTPPKAILK